MAEPFAPGRALPSPNFTGRPDRARGPGSFATPRAGAGRVERQPVPLALLAILVVVIGVLLVVAAYLAFRRWF